jgi:transposase
MDVTTVGIDLAKQVFQIHGVGSRGTVLIRKQLKRGEVAKFFATLSPCLVGMEACASAHHWARRIQAYGHTVTLANKNARIVWALLTHDREFQGGYSTAAVAA